ncbi:hypothetical protein ANO14919_088630 [Xylariales sp. No.14919]|nr:hypothetical protein ANO14919_088630 [Xylariales sp. No.14919]
MNGIVSSSATCNTHNALRNISEYACGVTFLFSDSANPPDMHYGVVSLQRCCDMVHAPVLRIPGNTACEIQFCEVDGVTSSYTETVYHASTTGSGTATRAPAPSVTEGATIGPPEKLENCLRFVYEGDLPDGISDRISYASSWSVVRFYDDELPPDEVRAAVLASPAPPSWTSAAADPFDKWLSGSSAPTATPGLPQTTPSSSSSRGIRYPTLAGLNVLAIATISMIGFAAF